MESEELRLLANAMVVADHNSHTGCSPDYERLLRMALVSMGHRVTCSNDWPLDDRGEHIGCGDEPACEMGECCCHDDGEDC